MWCLVSNSANHFIYTLTTVDLKKLNMVWFGLTGSVQYSEHCFMRTLVVIPIIVGTTLFDMIWLDHALSTCQSSIACGP